MGGGRREPHLRQEPVHPPGSRERGREHLEGAGLVGDLDGSQQQGVAQSAATSAVPKL